MRKLYHYHEPKIGSNCGDCQVGTYRKRMPVYPKALRFKMEDYEKAFQYLQGVSDFIKTTKMPEKCGLCPIPPFCTMDCRYGSNQCRILWRKIWEYVK